MTPKKWLLIASVVGAVLTTATAYFSRVAPPRQPLRHEAQANAAAGALPVITLAEVAGADRGFGPVMEAVLPAAENDGQTEILNLKTGQWRTTPRLEEFNGDVVALMTWIRTNGLNISCQMWPDGLAGCISYNMKVFPLETKRWEDTVVEDIPPIVLSSTNRHTPRTLLVLASGRPKIYSFRTDEGTVGILRLVALSDDRRGVKIRYKLVQARGDSAQTIATK